MLFIVEYRALIKCKNKYRYNLFVFTKQICYDIVNTEVYLYIERLYLGGFLNGTVKAKQWSNDPPIGPRCF